jgi:hypothetical protein
MAVPASAPAPMLNDTRKSMLAGPRSEEVGFAHDSALEGTGFELPVPGDSVRAEPISSQAASMLRYTTIQRISSETGDRCHS